MRTKQFLDAIIEKYTATPRNNLDFVPYALRPEIRSKKRKEKKADKKKHNLLTSIFSLLLTAAGLTIGCDVDTEIAPENQGFGDVDTDTGLIDTDEGAYPTDGWGYKPAVRRLDGLLSVVKGDVLPYIDLGGIRVSEAIWQSPNALEPIVWSIKGCYPCEQTYQSMDSGFVIVLGALWGELEEYKAMYPHLIFAADTYSEFGRAWEVDHWPETLRAYPTTSWVDPDTMVIAFEQIGFSTPEQKTEDFVKKYRAWTERER